MKIHLSNTACLIPARKGSSRVKNKNIAMFAGKPLLMWTFEAALKSRLTNIFFTTDYLPGELNFKIPSGIQTISRPREYCNDIATYDMYVRHFFERYPQFKYVVLLQPTCPLRNSDDVEKALDIYISYSRMETLASGYRIEHKFKLYRKNGQAHFGTELQKGENHMYVRNSAIYIFSQRHFLKTNSIFGSKTLFYEMPFARSFDINTQYDFNCAERMLKYKSGGLSDEQDFSIVNNICGV